MSRDVADVPTFSNHGEFAQHLLGLEDDPLAPPPGQLGPRIVVYRGSPEAKLMVVGEAPGAEEDKQGKPFVGRSGRMLDMILECEGFDPARDVYVSNIVRRRPPENRTPTKEEVDFYKPFVLEELRLVDPQVVVLAGAVAMQTLLSETRGITKVRGQWYERDGRLYMPWLHPSYLLRRPTKSKGGPKWLTWMDVKEVRRKYDELGCPHPARARGPRPGVLGGDRGGGKGHGDST